MKSESKLFLSLYLFFTDTFFFFQCFISFFSLLKETEKKWLKIKSMPSMAKNKKIHIESDAQKWCFSLCWTINKSVCVYCECETHLVKIDEFVVGVCVRLLVQFELCFWIYSVMKINSVSDNFQIEIFFFFLLLFLYYHHLPPIYFFVTCVSCDKKNWWWWWWWWTETEMIVSSLFETGILV